MWCLSSQYGSWNDFLVGRVLAVDEHMKRIRVLTLTSDKFYVSLILKLDKTKMIHNG